MPKILGTEHIDCPCCASKKSSFWATENGYNAVKCGKCGFVYLNPRPSEEEISAANKVGEHRTEKGAMQVVYRRAERKIRHYRLIIQTMMADKLDRPVAWLDVGTGFGELLESLQPIAPAGSKLDGIEPMLPKVESARARGLNVSATDLNDIKQKYDVISLINVFSHVPDFDGFIKLIKKSMKKQGIIFLETGNGADLASRAQYPDLLYFPDHLVFGGIKHVKKMLERNGFKVTQTLELRRDTLMFCLKNVVKKLLGREVKLVLPWQSPFRTVFFRAERVS